MSAPAPDLSVDSHTGIDVSLSVAGPGGVVPAELGGAAAVDAGEVQAVTASRAAAPMVSPTAPTPRPRDVRPPGRGIDMPPIMP